MFIKCDLKSFELSDNLAYCGIVKVNDVLLKRGNFVRPFIRNGSMKMIVSVGKRDYNATDQFVIASLNDYYKRVLSASTEEERSFMFQNYNRLYTSWTNLNAMRTQHHYKLMEECYDEIMYQLYLLGYKMSNS